MCGSRQVKRAAAKAMAMIVRLMARTPTNRMRRSSSLLLLKSPRRLASVTARRESSLEISARTSAPTSVTWLDVASASGSAGRAFMRTSAATSPRARRASSWSCIRASSMLMTSPGMANPHDRQRPQRPERTPSANLRVVGEKGDLGAVGQIELGEDVRHVGLHGGHAHVQPLRDLGVGEVIADGSDDLVLALGQLGERRSRPLPISRSEEPTSELQSLKRNSYADFC